MREAFLQIQETGQDIQVSDGKTRQLRVSGGHLRGSSRGDGWWQGQVLAAEPSASWAENPAG